MTVGVAKEESARKIWYSGMDYAIEKLKPDCVLCYGSKIEYDFKNIEVKYYEARRFN